MWKAEVHKPRESFEAMEGKLSFSVEPFSLLIGFWQVMCVDMAPISMLNYEQVLLQ